MLFSTTLFFLFMALRKDSDEEGCKLHYGGVAGIDTKDY